MAKRLPKIFNEDIYTEQKEDLVLKDIIFKATVKIKVVDSEGDFYNKIPIMNITPLDVNDKALILDLEKLGMFSTTDKANYLPIDVMQQLNIVIPVKVSKDSVPLETPQKK